MDAGVDTMNKGPRNCGLCRLPAVRYCFFVRSSAREAIPGAGCELPRAAVYHHPASATQVAVNRLEIGQMQDAVRRMRNEAVRLTTEPAPRLP